ncbi:hypothetical protein [Aquabacterium sp. OR-4]|uniref:hypothetical protein n=1 Tax=Aquabacterium sp. OR-4 TaxID=2978127 RepID=UPI0028C5AC1A|nr:hypothetical protein [Aquabacterium sp. OR-4]MDT7838869.1 hypothetical protein [Aquabacterium sp. OR-4]
MLGLTHGLNPSLRRRRNRFSPGFKPAASRHSGRRAGLLAGRQIVGQAGGHIGRQHHGPGAMHTPCRAGAVHLQHACGNG